ncbi:hypothetical protein [Burkholderia gladioli]|uniref:hypothetical protein n=1 Tax=Burkholderia gladioli TaxID=28095 RepID=UPI0011B1DD67|nr:hypothetical protein [Burkholderia gladioli]MBJ9663892.1 hypothetical protein [Burkholderia gladioli]
MPRILHISNEKCNFEKMREGYGARSPGLGRAWLAAVRARRITQAPSAPGRNARHMRVEVRVGVCEVFQNCAGGSWLASMLFEQIRQHLVNFFRN